MSIEPGVIRRLDEVVVNRIAAGEVIQRPANALKEMLENSLDAKATNITVVAGGGGLQLLQITDNGSGIRKEDMEIVCERFTTSKLRTFSDLSTISTYGFRGEALASISHVARLTILTRTRDSQCGYKAEYKDGKLIDKLKACAANPGTQITVEDLFYNVPTRRKALKSASDEFNRISDVVSKYAIHNSGVGFTLKKHGDTGNEVRTQTGADVKTNIAAIYGPSVAKELISFETSDQVLGFTAKGFISNVNVSSFTKFTMLLFINHRLVDSSAIKKSIEMVYAAYLPKGSHPFIYLAIDINPQNVDVNVHPTKHEVHFLHQDEIIEKIQKGVDAKLLGSNISRTFYTQTHLPGASIPLSGLEMNDSPSTLKTSKEDQPKNMVRTDAREQKLDKFLKKSSPTKSSDQSKKTSAVDADATIGKCDNPVVRREIKLRSVTNLRDQVSEDGHPALRDLIGNHSFVGCINRKMALLQHQTKLYIANTTTISEHLFYQIFLIDFGNFGVFKLSKPPSIHELAMMALNQPQAGWREGDGDKSELANLVVQVLTENSAMLDDYFSIEIDQDGKLSSLPILLEGYVPFLGGLPMYILRLATEVNWNDEESCFNDLAKETAKFYRIQSDQHSQYGPSQHTADGSDDNSWKYFIEHIIYPAAKQILIPPKVCATDMTFVQVANLPDLYKVFERC